MNYQESQPSPRLARYVKCFWSLKGVGSGTEAPEPVVPDGSIEIIFNLADRFRRLHNDGMIEIQPANIVAGQMRSHVTIGPGGDVRLLGVRFHPAGAFLFFRCALSELTDRIEDLDSIWGNESAVIAERLSETNDFDGQIAIIEDALLGRMYEPSQNGHSISMFAEAIIRRDGTLPVALIAKEFGIGERNLERQFKERIGLSPKTFSRIVRFQQVLRSVNTAHPTRVEIALAHGYFDQSHMINDFRRFAGVSPTVFLQNSHRMTELFTTGR